MLKTVINTIDEYNMIKNGDRLVVALSGGADSVCLLHVLCQMKKNFELSLEAVHINHCIRGEESDSDEKFCISLCKKLDVPIKVFRIDVPEIAGKSGKSLEETARDIRYEKFSECAGEKGKIVTAHTLSDTAETVVFNMIRGTGLKGLCGIPPVRGNIIRPLIGITRQQVEKFLSEIGQDFVTDSTNLSDDYTRNKIRHKIIPAMLEINKGFYHSFSNSQKAIRQENSFIEKFSLDAYEKCCKDNVLSGICQYPLTVRKRMISKFLSQNALPVSFDKINQINALADNDGKVNISKNVFVTGKCGKISIENQIVIQNIEKTLRIGNNSIFEGKIIYVSENINGDILIDSDKVCGNLVLRNRRYGDKIKLIGKNFTSSVKKLLNEKVSADKRPFVQFLADDEGLVFMEGFGIADRVKTDQNSKRVLSIELRGQ